MNDIDIDIDANRRPIVTITVNPALDVSSSVEVVTPERKLRCAEPQREPGGGGINVARVATRLGAVVEAVAVVGGPTGEAVVTLLEAEGLRVTPVTVEAETRQSLAVTERSTDRQFRFVLPGPPLDSPTVTRILSTLALSQAGAVPLVVVSGSVPPGTPAEAVTRLLVPLAESGADVIVDTSGTALRTAAESGVFLIKPSARELAALVERTLATEQEVTLAAQEVVERFPVGAVLASIGAGGAVLAIRSSAPLRLRAPAVQVRSAVGAGDSLVGGLVVGLGRGDTLPSAAALGVAAGTAATLTEGSGLCTSTDVDRLLPLVTTDNGR